MGLHRDTAPRAPLEGAGPQFQLRTHDWTRFLLDDVPRLEALGWKVETDDDFRHRITRVDEIDLDIQADPADAGWFNLGLDIQVEGRNVSMVPLLQQVLQSDPRWMRGQLDAIGDDENILLTAGDNTRLALRAARLKPIMALLTDLFAQRGAPLRLSVLDRGACRRGHGAPAVPRAQDTQALVQRLMQAPALGEVPPPAGLVATLRPYQREGLSWLQYLRQQGLGACWPMTWAWAKPCRRWRMCWSRRKPVAWTVRRCWWCPLRCCTTGRAKRHASPRPARADPARAGT